MGWGTYQLVGFFFQPRHIRSLDHLIFLLPKGGNVSYLLVVVGWEAERVLQCTYDLDQPFDLFPQDPIFLYFSEVEL